MVAIQRAAHVGLAGFPLVAKNYPAIRLLREKRLRTPRLRFLPRMANRKRNGCTWGRYARASLTNTHMAWCGSGAGMYRNTGHIGEGHSARNSLFPKAMYRACVVYVSSNLCSRMLVYGLGI